jgi:phosphatidylglycerophosphate synthase
MSRAGGDARPALDPRLWASAARNALAGVLLTGGLAIAAGGVLGLEGWFLAKALVGYGVCALVGLWFLPLHAPHPRLGPANQVTLARAVLTGLLAGLLGEAGTSALAWTAVGLALLAEVLDGVDGHLARRGGWVSELGARFDLEVDALLVAVLALLAWSLGKAGPWVLLSGLLRYGFVAAGYRWRWLRRPLPPSRRRQAVCVLQVLTLTLALAPVLPPAWSAPVAALGLALLGYSFAVDTLWLARHRGPGAQEGVPA